MTLSEKFGVSTMLMILAIVVAAILTNASKYMEVTTFNLLDARAGERVMLDYERTIKRDFEAVWTVDLYRDGVWIETARAEAPHNYRTTANLPDANDLDLDWLTYGDPAFLGLMCGSYSVAVRWIINPDSHIMRRVVEVHDDFMVTCQ